jgi:hypothetical protein
MLLHMKIKEASKIDLFDFTPAEQGLRISLLIWLSSRFPCLDTSVLGKPRFGSKSKGKQFQDLDQCEFNPVARGRPIQASYVVRLL